MSMKVLEGVDRKSFIRRCVTHRVFGVVLLPCDRAALAIPPEFQLGDEISGPTWVYLPSMGRYCERGGARNLLEAIGWDAQGVRKDASPIRSAKARAKRRATIYQPRCDPHGRWMRTLRPDGTCVCAARRDARVCGGRPDALYIDER
jgi:hypothetical protein